MKSRVNYDKISMAESTEEKPFIGLVITETLIQYTHTLKKVHLVPWHILESAVRLPIKGGVCNIITLPHIFVLRCISTTTNKFRLLFEQDMSSLFTICWSLTPCQEEVGQWFRRQRGRRACINLTPQLAQPVLSTVDVIMLLVLYIEKNIFPKQ